MRHHLAPLWLAPRPTPSALGLRVWSALLCRGEERPGLAVTSPLPHRSSFLLRASGAGTAQFVSAGVVTAHKGRVRPQCWLPTPRTPASPAASPPEHQLALRLTHTLRPSLAPVPARRPPVPSAAAEPGSSAFQASSSSRPSSASPLPAAGPVQEGLLPHLGCSSNLPLSTFAPLTVCFPCRDTLLNLKLIIQFSVQALKWLYCYSECSSASKAQHGAVFWEGLMLYFPVSFCSSSSGLAVSQMCPPGFCLGSCSRSLCWECSFPTAQLLFKSPFHLHPPVTFGPSALLNSCLTICHCCDLLLFDSKFRENRDGFVCYSSPIA